MFVSKNNPNADHVEAELISTDSKEFIQQTISNVDKVTVYDFCEKLCKPRSVSASVESILLYQDHWLIVSNKTPKRVWIINSEGFRSLYKQKPEQITSTITFTENIVSTDAINEIASSLIEEQPTIKTRRPRTRKMPTKTITTTEESIDIQ